MNKTLASRCAELLREIEGIGASEQATNLAIKCGDLLIAIQHGDEPRGEYTEEQRKLLNMTSRIEKFTDREIECYAQGIRDGIVQENELTFYSYEP